MTDTSAYYLSLANAALFLNCRTNNGGLEYSDSVESSSYYTKCLSQLAHRLLNKEESISEGVITTVLGFLCHDVGFLIAVAGLMLRSLIVTGGQLGKVRRAYRRIGPYLESPWGGQWP
jgi:hypothetical protein